jgi:hypothetical protein
MLFPCWSYPYCTDFSLHSLTIPVLNENPASTVHAINLAFSSSPKISTQTILTPRCRPIPINRFLLGRSLAFCVSRVLDCSPTNGLSSCHEREVRPYFYLQHQDNVHRRRLLLIDYRYTTSCFHAAQLACCERAERSKLELKVRLFSLFRNPSTTNNGFDLSTAPSSASGCH